MLFHEIQKKKILKVCTNRRSSLTQKTRLFFFFGPKAVLVVTHNKHTMSPLMQHNIFYNKCFLILILWIAYFVQQTKNYKFTIK